MTKEELKAKVKSVPNIEDNLLDMVLSYIDLADDIGFERGFKLGQHVALAPLEMIGKAFAGKR